MKNIGLIIKKYTDSIFNCLEENGALIVEELNDLKLVFEKDPLLFKHLNSQVLSYKQKNDLMELLASKFELNKITKNFILLLVKKNKFKLFIEIIDQLNKKIKKENNIYNGNVRLAHPISLEELDEIKIIIENKLSAKVILDTQIDKSILGGMVIDIENYRLDLSYLNILNQIKLKSIKILEDL